MNVLALDTAGGSCGVALRVGGRLAACRLVEMARGQAEALVPMIEGVLAEAGIAAQDIDLVGVTVGPGAFTGLRLGLATAAGYGLATGCGIVGVTTLEAFAAAVPAGEDAEAVVLVAAVDSRREEPFVQAFRPATPGTAQSASAPVALGDPVCRVPEALPALLPDGPVVVAGDAAVVVADALAAAGRAVRLAGGRHRIDPAVVAHLAESRAAEARPDPPPPLYLRPPDAMPAAPPRPILP